MHRVLLLGAGKIGRMIAKFLVDSGDYDVLVADYELPALARIEALTGAATTQIDASNVEALRTAIQGRDSVISALSFRFNPLIAETAMAAGANYFDLTEDIETTRKVSELVERTSPKSIVHPRTSSRFHESVGSFLGHDESMTRSSDWEIIRKLSSRRSCSPRIC